MVRGDHDHPEPGFKEPRRVKVEWVSTRADTPAARKATEEIVPVIQAVQFLAAFQPGGTGPSGDAFATQLALAAAGSTKEGKPSGLSPSQGLVALSEGTRRVDLAPGLKVNLKGKLLVSLNVLIALKDSGLHARVTPVAGVDLTF